MVLKQAVEAIGIVCVVGTERRDRLTFFLPLDFSSVMPDEWVLLQTQLKQLDRTIAAP